MLIPHMPGRSFTGQLPELTAEQVHLAADLQRDVTMLAETIGERHAWRMDSLNAARDSIVSAFESMGYRSELQTFMHQDMLFSNVICERPGTDFDAEIILIGAHYDTIPGSPGANDNGSGIAALLACARHFVNHQPRKTIRFVAFVNEEPPFFQSAAMGSYQCAQNCRRKGEKLLVMYSLETIGYFTDAPDSQCYPFPMGFFYPSVGNFIAFVGNLGSQEMVKKTVRHFRNEAPFPSEGAVLPAFVPGVSWSDQWSFWNFGYQAVMITDTAPFRYPYYHSELDCADRLSYDHFSRVVDGLLRVFSLLALESEG